MQTLIIFLKMKLTIVNKKKRKNYKKSEDKNDNSQNSNIITILLIILIVFSLIYTYNNLYLNNSSITSETTKEYDISQYHSLIQKAQYLTRKYQNLTYSQLSSSPNISNFLRSNYINEIMKITDNKIKPINYINTISLLDSKSVRKDVIVGIAQDTDPKNLVVFCASAYEIFKNDNVDIILFINVPLSQRTREIIDKYKIIMIEYNKKEAIDEKYQSYHPSTVRWILLNQYFQKKYQLYQRVIMIDVRDSYFQSNPFNQIFSNNINEPQFYAFQGVESLTIAQCGWNGGWVRDCFGYDIVDAIGDNAIICSGISMGTIDVVMKYLELMNDIVSGSYLLPEIKPLHPKFPTCERNGMDQGVHNVLVHKKLIPSLKIFKQADSLVANMQAHVAKYDENDFIVRNSKKEVVAIVHQYDRYSSLQTYLFKKYVYWLDSTDIESVWKDEVSCADYKYEEDIDLFRGKCDFKMQGGASTAATCCQICNEYKDKCEAFTFYSGVCYMKNCGKSGSSKGAFSLPGALSGYRIN